MSAQRIRAGRAYVELGTDDSRLVAGLRSAQAKLKSFGTSLAKIGGGLMGIGTAILGPMLGAASVFSASGDELTKMADRTGASVESLSELRHVAQQSAVDFKAFGGAMNKMQRNIADANDRQKTAVEMFERLGLSVQQLRSLSPDEQFEAIAENIAIIEDPALRAQAAMDFFGRSGAELLPLIMQGAQGIQSLRKEARDLGLQVSGQDAAAATLLADTWANVQKTLKDVVFEVGAALAPALTQAMNVVIPFVVGIADWISNNRQLVVTVAAVAAGILAAGAAFVALGAASLALAAGIGALITVGSTLVAILGAIISPLGIVIGLVIGVAAAFLAWTEAGHAVVDWFGTEFGKLFTIVQDTIGGMFDAIKGGRLDLAAKIAFTGVKLAIATVMESVLSLFGTSIDAMMEMLAAVLKRIGQVVSRLNVARVSVVNWLSGAIGAMVGVDTTPEQAAAMEPAQAGVAAWDNWDSRAASKAWADALDPDKLREELAQANAAAAQAADTAQTGTLTVKAIEMPDFSDITRQIQIGTAEASEKSKTVGTFSAAQAAQFIGRRDDIPKQQLDRLDRISRTAEKILQSGGLIATS